MSQINAAQILDGTIKNSDVASDANIDFTKIAITTTYVEDVRIPLNNMKVPTSNAPTWTKIKDDGSASIGVYAYAFDAANEESLFFVCQLPHSYKAGTNIIPHMHWVQPDTSTNSVVWGLEYILCRNNFALAANSTIISKAQAADGTIDKVRICYFDAISGSSLVESDLLCGRIFRKAGDASDTIAVDIPALDFDLHVQVNKFGT